MDKRINYNEANKSLILLSKILKVLYYIMIIGIVYLSWLLLKELKVMPICIKIIEVLIPLFIGFIIAWMFNPLVLYLCKNNFTRKSSTIIIYIILIILLYLILSLLIPVLNDQINELINNLPSMVKDTSNYLDKFNINMNDKIMDIIFSSSNYIINNIPSILINIIKSIVSFCGLLVIGLVIGFYLLINFDYISNYIAKLLVHCPNKSVKPLVNKINKQMYLYIKGTLLSSTILFICSVICFMIIGLTSPILFALFCAITNIIPFIGPYIGGIPAVLIGFSISNTTGILCLIVIIIIQLIESNIITPLIMSKSMKLHPVTIIISLLLFGSFGGMIGMLLAVPIVSIIKIVYEFNKL